MTPNWSPESLTNSPFSFPNQFAPTFDYKKFSLHPTVAGYKESLSVQPTNTPFKNTGTLLNFILKKILLVILQMLQLN